MLPQRLITLCCGRLGFKMRRNDEETIGITRDAYTPDLKLAVAVIGNGAKTEEEACPHGLLGPPVLPAAKGIKMMKKLTYGNTHTFLIGGLLLDTGYAGTLRAFYRELGKNGVTVRDIRYVLATHYHPDHMGLVGDLMEQGVGLLLMDVQKDAVHFSDRIFERDRVPFVPISEARAAVISCADSRAFLQRLGLSGQILHTPSHSPDSVSLILDQGDCFVGDLEPLSYLEAYGANDPLKSDWDRILAFRPKRVFYAHAPERILDS